MTQIDTSTIDGFRQGIELVEQKHFDAGIVKIWSGEKNSVSLQLDYGEETTKYNDIVFVDRSYSDAIQMLNSDFTLVKESVNVTDEFIFANTDQVFDFSNESIIDYSITTTIVRGTASHITTYPIFYGAVDYVAVREITFDGVLEPLNVRPLAIYLTSDVLGNVHSCNCNVEVGNIDNEKKTELVLTVDDYISVFVPYNDAKILQKSIMKTVGRFSNDDINKPFFDDRLLLNFGQDSSRGIQMDEAVSLMSGSTENYVQPGKRAMPSGFTYENCPVGTDSISFGGMSY